MWNESGIKTCPCKQVQIRTWTANLVRWTMWETVYQAESPQLNIDPCGSFCPSKTREANNKHIYIIPPVSWCWCPKGSAGSVFFALLVCNYVNFVCAFVCHFLRIIAELCGSTHCCLFTTEMAQTGRSERNEWVRCHWAGLSHLKGGLIQAMSIYKDQYMECMFYFWLT